MASLIVCEDLWKIYRVGDVEVQALRGINLTIDPVSYTHLTLPTSDLV